MLAVNTRFSMATLATTRCTRRDCLKGLLAGGAGVTYARLAAADETLPPSDRALELINTHTGEVASVIYRHGAEYDKAALATLERALRDHRSGETHAFDVKLFDQLSDLALAADRDPRYEIISGYRSPETNAKMATPGSGVAKKSLHMQGRAIDVRLKNYDSDDLRDLAIAAKRGGVGYYERSNFVHLDTGTFRTWTG